MSEKIKILKAEFLTSAESIKDAIAPIGTEVVFLGRSNVGKSTLINALTRKKNLAKTSSTPGKTRLINFFEVELIKDKKNINLRFVDLPGFGFAKVSKTEREKWQKNLANFLRSRSAAKLFLRLIDSRHPNLPQDQILLEFVRDVMAGDQGDQNNRADQKEFAVYTKSDKLNRKETDAIKRANPNAILVSSKNEKELENLWLKIIEASLGEYRIDESAAGEDAVN
ncbi:MAG: ribosome biogenesis GTP-binding protein YihA/YsxC [Helicobacteraceae bacterium]|jgi:GTP-binding protein|nr:ribosome biogenesis GTP-binding protein YihA/YsxC [Helicobacteraceae bacterium]